MASDNEDDDLDALREAALATLKQKVQPIENVFSGGNSTRPQDSSPWSEVPACIDFPAFSDPIPEPNHYPSPYGEPTSQPPPPQQQHQQRLFRPANNLPWHPNNQRMPHFQSQQPRHPRFPHRTFGAMDGPVNGRGNRRMRPRGSYLPPQQPDFRGGRGMHPGNHQQFPNPQIQQPLQDLAGGIPPMAANLIVIQPHTPFGDGRNIPPHLSMPSSAQRVSVNNNIQPIATSVSNTNNNNSNVRSSHHSQSENSQLRPKLVLPQDKYHSSGDSTHTKGPVEEPSSEAKSKDKFSRYDKSDSEEEDEDDDTASEVDDIANEIDKVLQDDFMAEEITIQEAREREPTPTADEEPEQPTEDREEEETTDAVVERESEPVTVSSEKQEVIDEEENNNTVSPADNLSDISDTESLDLDTLAGGEPMIGNLDELVKPVTDDLVKPDNDDLDELIKKPDIGGDPDDLDSLVDKEPESVNESVIDRDNRTRSDRDPDNFRNSRELNINSTSPHRRSSPNFHRNSSSPNRYRSPLSPGRKDNSYYNKPYSSIRRSRSPMHERRTTYNRRSTSPRTSIRRSRSRSPYYRRASPQRRLSTSPRRRAGSPNNRRYESSPRRYPMDRGRRSMSPSNRARSPLRDRVRPGRDDGGRYRDYNTSRHEEIRYRETDRSQRDRPRHGERDRSENNRQPDLKLRNSDAKVSPRNNRISPSMERKKLSQEKEKVKVDLEKLSPEERAKIEARMKKFDSKEEVAVTAEAPKKISLKDIKKREKKVKKKEEKEETVDASKVEEALPDVESKKKNAPSGISLKKLRKKTESKKKKDEEEVVEPESPEAVSAALLEDESEDDSDNGRSWKKEISGEVGSRLKFGLSRTVTQKAPLVSLDSISGGGGRRHLDNNRNRKQPFVDQRRDRDRDRYSHSHRERARVDRSSHRMKDNRWSSDDDDDVKLTRLSSSVVPSSKSFEPDVPPEKLRIQVQMISKDKKKKSKSKAVPDFSNVYSVHVAKRRRGADLASNSDGEEKKEEEEAEEVIVPPKKIKKKKKKHSKEESPRSVAWVDETESVEPASAPKSPAKPSVLERLGKKVRLDSTEKEKEKKKKKKSKKSRDIDEDSEDLDVHIRKMKAKNEEILRRQREIELDKEKYG